MDSKKAQEIENELVNDRKMLLGLGAIFVLAFLALAIRLLLPDLNPFILVGLGTTVYGVYLGSLLLSHLSRDKEIEESFALEMMKKDES